MRLPRRVIHAAEARQRYGDRLDRLAPALWRSDPLADDLVAHLEADPATWRDLDRALAEGLERVAAPAPPLVALMAQIERIPLWVDWDRMERAGRSFFRTGATGGVVLGARSLVLGYAAPAGNKPLVLTGQLERRAGFRLAETGRFVASVCAPGGLRPGGEGRAITVRVRLMHAQVRRLLLRSGAWRADDWGAPLNQHDLLATSLLFSQVWLDGIRAFGWTFSRDEAEDWLHLWRWCSTILGVEADLLPTTEAEAQGLMGLIQLTQEPPDEDSRRLVQALLGASAADAPGGSQLGWGLCRALLGPEAARALGVPETPWRHLVRGARAVVRPLDRLARQVPWLEDRLVSAGRQHWEQTIAQGLAGRPATFTPPGRLEGALAVAT